MTQEGEAIDDASAVAAAASTKPSIFWHESLRTLPDDAVKERLTSAENAEAVRRYFFAVLGNVWLLDAAFLRLFELLNATYKGRRESMFTDIEDNACTVVFVSSPCGEWLCPRTFSMNKRDRSLYPLAMDGRWPKGHLHRVSMCLGALPKFPLSDAGHLQVVDLGGLQLPSAPTDLPQPDGFFASCEQLRRITASAPCFLGRVGRQCFASNRSLKSVDFRNMTFESIGDGFLSNCTSLVNLDLSGLKVTGGIGKHMLRRCGNLVSVSARRPDAPCVIDDLDDLVDETGSGGFCSDCAKLEFINFHNIHVNRKSDLTAVHDITSANEMCDFAALKRVSELPLRRDVELNGRSWTAAELRTFVQAELTASTNAPNITATINCSPGVLGDTGIELQRAAAAAGHAAVNSQGGAAA